MKKTRLTTRAITKLIAGFAADKKAEDIIILDMREIANFCDYFVICTSSSDRRIRAIVDGIEEGLDKYELKLARRPSFEDGKWVVLDLGDIVVHIFEKEAREFYSLEHLWQDAPRIGLK